MKALVSGTNRGFGLSLWQELQLKGWRVVSLNRTCVVKSDDCFELDLAESDDSDLVLRRILELHQDISVVVLNAGVLGPIAPTSEVSPREMLETLEVNFFSPKKIADFMLQSSPATQTFVQISSGAATTIYPHWAPYGLSKLLLLRLFDYYRAEHPQKVFLSANPGPMATSMNTLIRTEASSDLQWKTKFLDDQNLNHPAKIAGALVRLLSTGSRDAGPGLIDLRTL